MKTCLLLSSLSLVLIQSASAAEAVANPDDTVEIWNRLSFSGRLGFNINARFQNLNRAGSANSGADHFYGDGFIRVDSSRNAGSQTWFWGYQNSSQIANDTLQMHESSVTENRMVKADGDPQPGFELAYSRHLKTWGRVRFGAETAFGFTDVFIRDRSSLQGTITTITDSYPLGGIVPPLGPYSGSFAGPGPLIGDLPTRSISTSPVGSALIDQNMSLEASFYQMRLGPNMTIQATDHLTIEFGGGVTLAVIDADFVFDETITNTGVASHNSYRSSKSSTLPGGYLRAGVVWKITNRVGVFADGQCHFLGRMSQQASDRQAELDFGSAFFFGAGVRFNF